HDGILYTYGFLVSARMVHEEWLFAYYSSQESCVFERVTKDNRTEVKPGTRLIADGNRAQFIDFLAQGTRPNQLFLTEANEKNVMLLKPVIHWFSEHLCIVRPDSRYHALALRADKDKDFIEYLSDFLHVADTGVVSIRCENEEFDPDKHLKNVPEEERQGILDYLGGEGFRQLFVEVPTETFTIRREETSKASSVRYLKLKTEHIRADGSKVAFDIINESDGTRRIMHLAPMLQQIWTRDSVFIIDELDRSLHTHLSRLFIQSCITGSNGNQARGQCIMTTHDTNLLDRALLRRDEIWFMEKDTHGASHLTSLAEYKVSEGLNYENGYLNGRFGAIPFVGDTKELLQ
ncbi:MAG: AAA family ATPase, partial [bacterium]|nr:AAA family ATPase [bacterium]